ncbi:restriction endonuclease subunit S [Flagellimonas lutaonensis]|nr:restriction endonuclease subunit S [Allomuricauda lutaonensis]
MSEWKEVISGEVLDLISGYAFKSKDFKEVPDEDDLPVIKIKNVANGDVNFEGVVYHQVSEKLEKYTLEKGDILIAMTGNHPHAMTQVVGDVSRYKLAEKALLNQRVGKLVTKDDNCLDFFYYYFKDEDNRNYLANQSSGSANQANISKGDILGIPMTIPEPEEQRAIASVLSSLDDKIDLLHRQNQTLEQMAETLFRQWFLPAGRHGVEEADEGWEEKSLSEYFHLLGGFAFKSKDYIDVGKYKVITIKGVQDGYLDSNSAARLDTLPEKIKPYQILTIGDILMSLTGNVGRVCLVDEENCLLNQRVAKIEPINKEWKPFAYFYFRQREMIERLTYLSKGSAQLNLSPVETLAQTERFPDDMLINNYCEVVNPILFKIMKNKTQIRTLTALRDTLLPKLMSGEVRVDIDNGETQDFASPQDMPSPQDIKTTHG